jgi:hypothetical protein
MPALISPVKELSPWVGASTPPLRTGVFQVADIGSLNEPWYSFWDGRWHGGWTSPDEAFEHKDFPTPGSVGKWWAWRGLLENPLAESTGAQVTLLGAYINLDGHTHVSNGSSQ